MQSRFELVVECQITSSSYMSLLVWMVQLLPIGTSETICKSSASETIYVYYLLNIWWCSQDCWRAQLRSAVKYQHHMIIQHTLHFELCLILNPNESYFPCLRWAVRGAHVQNSLRSRLVKYPSFQCSWKSILQCIIGGKARLKSEIQLQNHVDKFDSAAAVAVPIETVHRPCCWNFCSNRRTEVDRSLLCNWKTMNSSCIF